MNIALVFSFNVGINDWKSLGLYDREIRPYIESIKLDPNIRWTFFTYDFEFFEPGHPAQIKIVPMGQFLKRVPKVLWPILSLFLPWVYRQEFRQCHLYKTNQIWGSWVAVVAKFFFGRKLLVRAGYDHYANHLKRHSPFYKRWLSFLISHFAYKNADAIQLTSDAIKNFVVRNFKIDPNKIFVHGNYIDTEHFIPKTNVLERMHNRLLYVGRINIHKNLKALITAAHENQLAVDIVGQGEMESELKAWASKNHFEVKFLGSIPNAQLPDIYDRYQVFCLPSLFEGNPKVLLEAMSMEMIVVGSDIEGIQDIIIHKNNGFLTSVDPESISKTLNDIVRLTEKEKIELGKQARKTIVEKNSLQSYVHFEQKILRSLCLH